MRFHPPFECRSYTYLAFQSAAAASRKYYLVLVLVFVHRNKDYYSLGGTLASGQCAEAVGTSKFDSSSIAEGPLQQMSPARAIPALEKTGG